MATRKRNTTTVDEYRLLWTLKDEGRQTGEILREMAKAFGPTKWEYTQSNKAKIRRIVADGVGREALAAKIRGRGELEPEFEAMVGPFLDYREGQATVEEAVEGFRLFFNRFSGRELPAHAGRWVTDALSYRRVLINCPPRHAKSTIMSVWLPIFLVCADRNIQILLVSQTDDFAQKFALEIVEHFESDEDMIAAFGHFVPDEASWPWAPRDGELMVAGRQRLRLPGDRTIQIRGARQQILGMEADWIICDDVDSPDVVRSDTTRKRFREWFDMQVITRLNPRGTAVCIGQRLAPLDLYGYLAAKRRERVEGKPPLWTHIVYKAVQEWPTEGREAKVLWPEIWPYDELMYAYDELGEYGFATMYQQDASPAGARLIKEEWVFGDEKHPGCVDVERTVGSGYRETQKEEGFVPSVRALSIDPSPTENWGLLVADIPYNPAHDRFEACLVHSEGKRYSVQEAKARIEWLLEMYKPVDYLVWEDSAVSNWLKSDPWFVELSRTVKVISHKTHGKSKGDPSYGVQSLAIEFEFGRIRIPWAGADERRMFGAFLEECYDWPLGEYDDQLMALWFLKYVRNSLYPYQLVQEDGISFAGTAFDTSEWSSAWSEIA